MDAASSEAASKCDAASKAGVNCEAGVVFSFGDFGVADLAFDFAPDAAITAGVAFFGAGVTFCVAFKAVFKTVEEAFLATDFDPAVLEMWTSAFETVGSTLDKEALGFGVGLAPATSESTLATERTTKEGEERYELVGE